MGEDEGRGAETPGRIDTTNERLADVARCRGKAWSVLALTLAPPSSELEESLRTRSLFGDLAEALGWMDLDRERFAPYVALLDAVAQRADREPAAVRGDLEARHERSFEGPDAHIALEMVAWMSARCGEEGSAWAAGDVERAKALRLDQHRFLEAADVAAVARFCRRLQATDQDGLYGASAGILLELIRTESGRDHTGSVVRKVFGDGGG